MCTFADTIILSSYSKNIGALTVSKVITSAVGVIMAAMIRIITMAYLLLAFMNAGVISPNFDRINIKIGSKKTIPHPNVNVAIVDK